jgi:hypothetical protein
MGAMDSPFSQTAAGVRANVRVTPRAGRSGLTGVREGRLLLKVAAAPEGGKANAALLKLLSKAWGVPQSSIEIVAGASGREKVLLVRGVTAEHLLACTKANVGDSGTPGR